MKFHGRLGVLLQLKSSSRSTNELAACGSASWLRLRWLPARRKKLESAAVKLFDSRQLHLASQKSQQGHQGRSYKSSHQGALYVIPSLQSRRLHASALAALNLPALRLHCEWEGALGVGRENATHLLELLGLHGVSSGHGQEPATKVGKYEGADMSHYTPNSCILNSQTELTMNPDALSLNECQTRVRAPLSPPRLGVAALSEAGSGFSHVQRKLSRGLAERVQQLVILGIAVSGIARRNIGVHWR